MIRSPRLTTARRRRTKRIRTPDAAWSLRGSPQSAMLPVPNSVRLVSTVQRPVALKALMHLLVLSAFRPTMGNRLVLETRSQCTFWCSVLSDEFVEQGIRQAPVVSQCTFWCSVLSDLRTGGLIGMADKSQCTFWCSVLSDWVSRHARRPFQVSMHLLVLSAFRL